MVAMSDASRDGWEGEFRGKEKQMSVPEVMGAISVAEQILYFDGIRVIESKSYVFD
jgi:hypothetical protein